MTLVTGRIDRTIRSVIVLLSVAIGAFLLVLSIFTFSASLDLTVPIWGAQINKLPVSLIIFIASIASAAVFYTRHKADLVKQVKLYQTIFLIFILVCGGSSVVVFSQNCMNYGMYDTADPYKIKPQVVLLDKSATRRVRIKKSRRDCLYLSAITWTTIGYGDVIPSDGLRPMAAFEGFVAYLFMALLVSSLIETMK